MQNKTPYKLLLQSNRESNTSTHRTQQQIELLSQLIVNNNIFAYLNLAKNTLRQLCDKLTLIWADNPHAIQINQSQIYLVLEGKAFQYLHNTSYVLKTKMHNNQEYLMVRKLLHNDFFIVYSPNTKYANQFDYKKYQLMIDKNTLVGRISGELYRKYMLPLIEERSKKIVGFLKKVQMLQHIPQAMLYQLSKYMELVQYQAGSQIINRNQKNPFVFFIVKGQVQYRVFSDTEARQTPNKHFLTVNKKQFKKANLEDNQVFGIDAFHSETYDQVQLAYSTQAKTKCSLYKIDKRILAIVISSFENILPKKNKIWSSVNLNEQIQGQGYQTSDMIWLSRNAEKIKTSQKRIRDIKLRFYNTSHRNRKQTAQQTDNDKKQQQFYTIQDVKYQSCQNFAQIKISSAKNKKFYQTINHKVSFNKLQAMNEQAKNKMNKIVLTPYQQIQTQTDSVRRQIHNGFLQSTKTLLSKRNSKSNLYNGKQESDIIRSYLQKKLKNQMLKKAQLILQRNKQKLIKQNTKIKRIYSWKSLKNRTLSKQDTPKKQIGDQLYQKMNHVNQNPLFSQIQGQRKKLEIQQIKFKQSQLRTSKKKSSPQKLNKQLIVIENN